MDLLFPLLLALLAVFMFLSIRNQKKRANQMQDMQNSVTPGARVQLHSGLYGTVTDATSNDVVDVEIAPGLVTRWNRLAIREIVPAGDVPGTYPGVSPAESLDDEFPSAPDTLPDDLPDSGAFTDRPTGELDRDKRDDA